MDYSISETLIWQEMASPIFRYLATEKPQWKIATLKQSAKKNYREIIGRTHSIGSWRQNPLRVCLSGGAVWLAIYQAADGKMDEALFDKMVDITLHAPKLQAIFRGQTLFSVDATKQNNQHTKITNPIQSPANWETELIVGRDVDELHVRHTRCGLCALGIQEKALHLVQYMCKIEAMAAELSGATLFSTQTLATGSSHCELYICKNGSQWERERTSALATGKK